MGPTPRDRVLAATRGKVLDRPAFAVWRHFYDAERPGRARALARALVDWVRACDLDLLKYNPRAQYHAEPWGTRYRYPGGEGKPVLERYAVRDPAEWATITPRPLDEPAFAELFEGLALVRAELPEVPVLMTIFTPLAVLERLAGKERVLADLRERPGDVLRALAAVADTFAALAAALVAAGADGIFLATTVWAEREVLSDEAYATFGRPFDLRVLAAARDAPFNVLHVCGADARVFELAAYPVVGVSWNARAAGNPAVRTFLERVSDRVAIGGYSDEAFTAADPARLSEEGNELPWLDRRWIAAGGCTIPPASRAGNIELARDLIRVRGAPAWTR